MKISREGDDVVYTMPSGHVRRARIVKAIPVSRKSGGIEYEITCPFCSKKHTHGPVEGTRVPHCPVDDEVEYYLRPIESDAASAPLWPWGFCPPSLDERSSMPEVNAARMTVADKIALADIVHP